MTNQLFSALLFCTVQYQIDMKDLHLSCSSTLAFVQDWNIFSQVLPFSLLFTGCAVWEGETLTWGPFDLVLGREQAHSCTQTFSLPSLPGSQVSLRGFVRRNRAPFPSGRRGACPGGPAERAGTRRAGCRTTHPQGTLAPILPFSPAFLERAAELKLTLAQRQEMLFCWSHRRVFRTAQDPTWHLFYRQTFCRL